MKYKLKEKVHRQKTTSENNHQGLCLSVFTQQKASSYYTYTFHLTYILNFILF